MSFDLNTFATNIAAYGYSSANKFDVQFSLPRIMTQNNQNGNVNTVPKLLQLRASDVVLPAVLLMSQEINRYGMGPVTTQPYNAKVSDVPMTFILDQDDIIFQFFYNWINSVYSFSETAENNLGISNTNLSVTQPNYTTNYEDDIISDTVTISHYDNLGNVIKSINLYRVKPTLIGAVPLKWDATDTLMKLTVNFTYREWARITPSTTNIRGVKAEDTPTQ